MKKIVLIFCLLCFANITRAQSSKTIDLNQIIQLIDKYVIEENIPSVVVGIVQNGQLIETISRGEMKRDSGQKVNGQTLYQIGSLSKSFTAIIINSLEEEGLLSVNDPLSKYLEGDIPSDAIVQYQSITLASVLQHRAGLPNNGASIPPTPNGTAMKGGYGKEAMLKDLSTLEVDTAKVGKFNYSNLGFAIMGYVAQKVSGESYEELLQKYIAQPLGMSATTTLQTQEVMVKAATPYMVGGDRTRETSAWEMGLGVAGGGVLSNIKDLSKLMIAEMQAFAKYKAHGAESPLVLTAHTQELNEYMDYGFGFFDSRNTFDSTVVQMGHGGDLDGFASQFEYYPNHDMGLIMLTASGFGGWNELKSMIERVMLGIPLPAEISVTKDIVKRYTGTYQFTSGSELKLYRKGKDLKVYIKGWGSQTLYAQNETRFNWRGRNAALEFELDAKGKLSRAVYIENGKKHYPKKIK